MNQKIFTRKTLIMSAIVLAWSVFLVWGSTTIKQPKEEGIVTQVDASRDKETAKPDAPGTDAGADR